MNLFLVTGEVGEDETAVYWCLVHWQNRERERKTVDETDYCCCRLQAAHTGFVRNDLYLTKSDGAIDANGLKAERNMLKNTPPPSLNCSGPDTLVWTTLKQRDRLLLPSPLRIDTCTINYSEAAPATKKGHAETSHGCEGAYTRARGVASHALLQRRPHRNHTFSNKRVYCCSLN